MKIQSLYIRNFRSIGPEGLTISFDTQLSALIGKNNVGKSNILAAIDYILGGYWPSEKDFTLEDFYQRNVNNDIEISVFFEEPLEHTTVIQTWYEHKTKVAGFKLEYKTYKRDTEDAKAGELHLEYNCINVKGEIIRLPTKAPGKGEKYKEFLSSFTSILRVTRELRNQVRVIYIPVERDVLKFSPSNSRSLLGILIKTIKERFSSEKEFITISDEFAKEFSLDKKVTRETLFNKLIERANDTLRTEDLTLLSRTLATYLIEHVGEVEGKEINFDFSIQDTWAQFKNIELTIQNNGVTLPAHRVGQGFQSLIVISIFRTYLQYKNINAIFLFEEPEMFLHTHAKKYFYQILRDLGIKGTQIIYTTHSTEFLDILNYKEVKRVVMKKMSTNILPKKNVELDFNNDELLKLNTAINNERAELFFADKVLLVEGDTEKIVFDYLIRLKGIDPNLNNISIIETSGKGSMYRYISLLESFEIPFVAVVDTDILEFTGDETKDKRIKENNTDAERKNNKLSDTITDKKRLFFNHPYLELVAGITTKTDKKMESKPLNAIQYFQQFENYMTIHEKFKTLVQPIELLT